MAEITKLACCPMCGDEIELGFDPEDPEDDEIDCPVCKAPLLIEYDTEADEVTLVEDMSEDAEQPEDVEADDEEDEEEES